MASPNHFIARHKPAEHMMQKSGVFAILVRASLIATILSGCSTASDAPSVGPAPRLPAPEQRLIPTVNIAPALPWAAGEGPVAAAGLKSTRFADGLAHPRWLLVLPNGDVLVAESNAPRRSGGSLMDWIRGLVMKRAGAATESADRITLLRDADGDGVAETRSVFLRDLHSPFGMALVDGTLFVANADALVRVPYVSGSMQVDTAPVPVLALPSGRNHHWTKNVIASPDGKRLYVTVGSNSNIGENGLDEESERAAVWEIDPATGAHRVFAHGLRNPNGLAWMPQTGALWTVVNERDELGNDLVPDYLTSVKDGAFYGWPYSYWGTHVDTRVKPQRPDLVVRALAPDYALGAHVAALGLATSVGLDGWPKPFAEGMFIGEHGSWNRDPLSGYKVVFVPFAGGRPSAEPVDVLTGFVDAQGRARGRPVGVAVDGRGGLLVADDVGNAIWRVVNSPTEGHGARP